MSIDTKILSKTSANQIHQCMKRITNDEEVEFSRVGFKYQCNTQLREKGAKKQYKHLNRWKKLRKIQHSFLLKISNKLGRKENLLNLIKGIYKSPQMISYLVIKD